MNYRHEAAAGLALPLTLFTITCVLFFGLSAYALALHGLKLLTDHRHGTIAKRTAVQKAIESSATSPHTHGKVFSVTMSAQTGMFTITRSLYGLSGFGSDADQSLLTGNPIQPFPLLLTLFKDLNDATCLQLTAFVSNKSSQGLLLSPSSARALNACLALPAKIKEDLKFQANLDISNPVAFSGVNGAALAATGYIDIGGEVTIEAPTIIIAGGDLRVMKLSAIKSIPVTLISMLGIVRISEIVGPIQLNVMARLGAYLPQAPSPPNGLRPKTTARIYTGLSPAHLPLS
jgi:hypothetical protein